jgi:hypothetical protein
MSTWFYIKHCAKSGFKGHVGPVELMPGISTSLFARGMARQEIDAGPMIERFTLDLFGGMISVDAHKTEIEIEGLTLTIHTRDIRVALDLMERCWEREDIGGGHVYHKIHGRFNCLCLLPRQFAALRDALREVEPAARAVEAAEGEELIQKLAGSYNVVCKRDVPEVPKA